MTAGLVVNIVVVSMHSNDPNKEEEECRTRTQTGEFVKYKNSPNQNILLFIFIIELLLYHVYFV